MPSSPNFPGRHLPLAIVLALAACGGGSAVSDSVAIVSTAGSGSLAPAPAAAPAPTPTPSPSPTATVGVAAPSLEGVEAISSGLAVDGLLQPSWGTGEIPGQEDPGQLGAFRFLCAPSHNAYNDPIVYPGQPGKSHLHTFFGNTKADADSTYASLRTTGDSTCNNALNRSAYWIPAMMNGRGKVVMPDYVAVYYKRAPSSGLVCTSFGVKACLKMPRGLRYIFGYNMQNPAGSDPAEARWWNCDGPGAVSGHFATIKEAAAGCPTGARLGGIIFSAPCWNGKDLDTADHRSHMAFPQQDGNGHSVCPASHPYILPSFQLGAWYTNDGTAKDWFLSSDRMAGMANMEPGSTLHADWFGAWEDSILDLWDKNCLDKTLSCNGADLGDGRQLKTTNGYSYGNVTTLVDPPAQ